MLISCYDKASQTIISLANCRIDFQKNHKEYAHEKFQMEHPLLHLKFQNLKLDSLNVFQKNYYYLFFNKSQVK